MVVDKRWRLPQASVITAVAPTRICDIGGWTDTWFARFGAICSIAVYPYVEVQIHIRCPADTDNRLLITAENLGRQYAIKPGAVIDDRHPLIEAVIDAVELPQDIGCSIHIFSHAPPGASMGTSAAVAVALIGALYAVIRRTATLQDVAALAHAVETTHLGLQCGIQDQLASAYGGINYLQMSTYPHARVSPVPVPDHIWWELEHRLALVYIGVPHTSHDVHTNVIAGLGERAHADERLQRLRELADEAKTALATGDFPMFGTIIKANTEVQRLLHKDVICWQFDDIMAIARDFRALGWKVNGAGGTGGSITILTDGDMAKKRRLLNVLTARGYQPLPISIARQGLRVW